MLKKLISLSLLACIVFYSNSCTKDAYYPDVCFQTDILPIFLSNCATSGCHNSKEKSKHLDLSNYDGILKSVKPHFPSFSSAYTKISSGEMPPRGYAALSEKQINLLKAWINMGAPNSSGCGISCDTAVHTFANGVKPILDIYCKGCHSDKISKGGINFSTYDGVTAIKNSRLLSSIKHEAGFLPMPEGAPSLSDCQIGVIEKWINAGALND